MFTNLKKTALTLGLLAGIASLASAQTTTYSTTGLNSMDHHSLYTWNLSGIDLTGKYVSSATLTFTGLYNWNTDANVLHIHLLDTSINSGLTSFLDDNPALTPSGGSQVDLTDDFKNARYHNGKDATGATAPWLVAAGTGDTFLADVTRGTTAQTYSYDFVAGNTVNILDTYIRNGNNVAFGIDPDCHYYASNVTLSITTQPGSNINKPIPEPGSIALLVGMAPLAGAIVARRRMAR